MADKAITKGLGQFQVLLQPSPTAGPAPSLPGLLGPTLEAGPGENHQEREKLLLAGGLAGPPEDALGIHGR